MKKKYKIDCFPWRHVFVYYSTCFSDILCWLIVLFIRAFGGELTWKNGLWCIVSSDSFLKKTLFKNYSGGTLGHGGWLAEGKAAEFHEHVHVEQYEDATMSLALVNDIWLFFSSGHNLILALTVRTLAGAIVWLAAVFVTFLRGEDVYRGSHTEEAAYAIDEVAHKKR